ncbi:MAG: glycosyltransferase family 4 protein [Gemmataceae bacterium]
MTAPLRILELRSVRGTGGGPEKTILQGAARTDPARFQITVCYLRDRRDPLFNIDQLAGKLAIDYVEIREKHSFDLRVWPALCRLVRERQIELVHAHDYKTDFLAYLLGRRQQITPLATAHGWTGMTWRERLYYRLDRKLLVRLPRVIAVSSAIRDDLLRAGARPEQVATVLNGIDAERFRRDPARMAAARARHGLRAGDVAIGAIARLEPEKRLDLLLDAFARVRRQHVHARLLLAGAGSLRPALEAQAGKLGLGEACTFLGLVDDVIELHHALDLFVQSSDYEGTSNSLLEALAMETPVVATDVGGTRELVADGEHGLIVPPSAAAGLAAGIETALADREAARERAVSARARVERKLSFAARMQTVEEIYQQLGNGRCAK